MAIITTLSALREVVAEYSQYDEFVFDLETVYKPTSEEQERYDRVKAVPAKQRSVDDGKWLEIFEYKATDPLANEINWIGLAGPGGSSVAIPVGHPKGRQTRPPRQEKMFACDVYPEGDKRGQTASGAPSKRAVVVKFPAEFDPPPEQLPIEVVIEELRPLFFADRFIIGQNVKFDVKTLVKYFGEWPTASFIDIIICQHLLNERLKDYGLEKLTARHFKTTYDKLGKKGVHNFSYGKAARYVVQDCRYEWLLWRKFKDRLQRVPTLWRFLTDYAIDIYDAIMRMEYEGVEVNTRAVAELRIEKEKAIAGIVDKLIVDYGAPENFNPNADAQKRALVFDKYKGKATKVTEKTQMPSVDAESLEAVATSVRKIRSKSTGEVRTVPHPAAPVARLLLDYAEENKILSTYLVGIPNRLDRRNRVHADYLLYGTETSRLSCVTSDTLVRTLRGAVPIVDVRYGDKVLTHRGRWRRVDHLISQGVAPVAQIRFASGASLVCTEDHRLHTPEGWVHVRDLRLGTEVYCDASFIEVCESAREREAGGRLLHGKWRSDLEGGSAEARNVVPQRASDRRRASHSGSTPTGTAHQVQQSDYGQGQPDVRAHGGGAPSVQGDDAVLRRVHDVPPLGWRGSGTTAPCHLGGVVGRQESAEVGHGAPHRRQQEQQRAGQLGAGDQGGAQPPPFATTHVVAITALGSEPVFDLTIEEDASFLTNGLLSHNCREPNIQNIPRESDMRSMFVAPKGFVFIIGDYNQIELRKIAVDSGDPALIQLFNSGEDVHRGTAAAVLNKPFEETTDEERQLYGKMPNFLVGYGGGASNLAEKTGVSIDHAQEVIDKWFRRFRYIQPWKQRTVREAKARATFGAGREMLTAPYVETMLGRRRRLPELYWDDGKARSRAERQAVNTVIQGSASETALLAMVAVTKYTKRTGFPMPLVINVHDELVATVPAHLADEGMAILGKLMEGVTVPHTGEKPLKGMVPLEVKVVSGEVWLK